MTVYGGRTTDGFYVVCTKCGWHSQVKLYHIDEVGFKSIVLECEHCGNIYKQEIT